VKIEAHPDITFIIKGVACKVFVSHEFACILNSNDLITLMKICKYLSKMEDENKEAANG